MTIILSAADFAQAMGIVERVARRHFAKGTYRGHHLPVVELDGQQGGASGKVYGLVLAALPTELRAKFELNRPGFTGDL